MADHNCNRITIDSAAVIGRIRDHFIRAFRDAEDELLEIMEREVMQTVHGNGPGKPAWRAMVQDRLDVVTERFVDLTLEADVGVDANMQLTDFIKAMVVAEGAGSAGPTGHCIVAGPNGRSVWDNNLDGKHPSNAKSQYMLPPGFNQVGNHFVENAVRIMENRFRQIMENAMRSLPDSVIYGNVHVSRR